MPVAPLHCSRYGEEHASRILTEVMPTTQSIGGSVAAVALYGRSPLGHIGQRKNGPWRNLT
jgi:hypothetical protein